MGLIKAATSSVGGGLADQWLEVIEPDNMGDTTVMTKGVFVRKDDKRGSNRKGTDDVLTDGSVVHVLSMVAKSSITLLKRAIIQSKMILRLQCLTVL